MIQGYIFEHERRQYDPNGLVVVPNAEEHNAALERAELAYWATKPDRFVAYYNKNECARGGDAAYQITTWRGTVIGTITRTTKGYGPSGHSLLYIRVRGTNGARYYGKFGHEWTQAVRLRRCV